MTKDELVEKVAEAIASQLGDELSMVPENKAAWIKARGMCGGFPRDINAPFRGDYIAAARAALAIAMPAAFEMAAEVASWAHMVPPDGGSPSEAECLVAKNAAAAIRAEGGKWK